MTLAEYCKTEADAMRHRPGGKDVARWLERYAAIPNARTRCLIDAREARDEAQQRAAGIVCEYFDAQWGTR